MGLHPIRWSAWRALSKRRVTGTGWLTHAVNFRQSPEAIEIKTLVFEFHVLPHLGDSQ